MSVLEGSWFLSGIVLMSIQLGDVRTRILLPTWNTKDNWEVMSVLHLHKLFIVTGIVLLGLVCNMKGLYLKKGILIFCI